MCHFNDNGSVKSPGKDTFSYTTLVGTTGDQRWAASTWEAASPLEGPQGGEQGLRGE